MITKVEVRQRVKEVLLKNKIDDLGLEMELATLFYDELKKFDLEIESPSEKHPVTRDEMKAFIAEFSKITGLPQPNPKTSKERSRIADLWYQPVRRMIETANGSSLRVIALAVKRMESDRLTIYGPRSAEAVFMDEYRKTKNIPSDPTPENIEDLRQRLIAHRESQKNA